MSLTNALTAVGGIAGMFGRNNQTEQNIRLLASAARRYGPKYGFNPLTLLGASGGMAGGSGGSQMSSGAFLGEAIGRAADTFFNTPSNEDIEAETIKKQAQSAMLDRAAAARDPYQNFGFALTDVAPSPMVGEVSVPALATQRQKDDLARDNSTAAVSSPLGVGASGSIFIPDPTLDASTGLYVGSRHWQPYPGMSNGQVIENEYGDSPAAWPFQFNKLAADIAWNLKPLTNPSNPANRPPRRRPPALWRRLAPTQRKRPGFN